MYKFPSDYWALILGGSSGFGLATARKLSRHGMNLYIVHRDRRGEMARLESEFEEIRKTGVQLITHNGNALSQDNMSEVCRELKRAMGEKGSVRLLLHSIAYGNLKLMVPTPQAEKDAHAAFIKRLAEELNLGEETLQKSLDKLFADHGMDQLAMAATPPAYSDDHLLQDEDFSLTVYSMGTSLASWVQKLFRKGLFAGDARVIGLTSEGNEVSWKSYAAVSAAKVALEAVARSIAREFAPYGLRANIIQAGVTDTPALRVIPGSSHLKATARIRNPFKRLTRPEDVADFVYLMCLDEAAWANGNIIRLDGGEHISG